MRRREMLIIAALVLLAVMGPALLIARSFGNLAAYEEQTRPFEGTAQELYAQHAQLLNEAAEILWAHPEFFEDYRVPGENDGRFPLYEIRRGWEVEHPFTEVEWQILLALSEHSWLTSVWYYWDAVPSIKFGVRTEAEEYSPSLWYICREGLSEHDIKRTMSYHMQIYEAHEWLNTSWCIAYFKY